jgi:hypothetical protein
MKKIILSVAFTIGFGVYGFSTNKILVQTQGEKERVEVTPSPRKIIPRYDFSLFKFAKPLAHVIPKDSNKISGSILKHKSLTDETTYHQEKPLSFFTFSYAS